MNEYQVHPDVGAAPNYLAVLLAIERLDERKDRLLLMLLERAVQVDGDPPLSTRTCHRRQARIILIAEAMKAVLWEQYDAELLAFTQKRSQHQRHIYEIAA